MPASRCQIRVLFSAPLNLGPGKVRLLEAIRETGSISGAARLLRISYRRAWLMADALNKAFPQALVDTAAGGAGGGGARLSPMGEEVVTRYRAMVDRAEAAVAPQVAGFMALMGQESDPGAS
jgi:molybdate transport system regulatory protein